MDDRGGAGGRHGVHEHRCQPGVPGSDPGPGFSKRLAATLAHEEGHPVHDGVAACHLPEH